MNFGDFYLNRVILELNYDEGHLYWDNCGATNLDILKKFPNWIWERTTTELSTFREKKKRIELLFNIQHIRFIQDEVDNLNQFKEAATEITPIILQHLQIDAFSRVGNRFIYVSSLDNIEKGKEIIQKSRLIEIPNEKLSLFGENPEKTGFRLYIKNGDLQYRIEITTIKRIEKGGIGKIDEKFFPELGLRVDVDFVIIKKVNVSDFSSSEFIQGNYKFLESNLMKFIRK